MKFRTVIFFLILFPSISFSQAVFQDMTNRNIYDFLDELANEGIISLHSSVKPYPRILIAEDLKEAFLKKDKLNKRQQNELGFYLKDYRLDLPGDLAWLQNGKGILKKNHFGIPWNPLAFLYKDSLLTFSVRPVLGIKFNYSVSSGDNAYHWWSGAETFGTIGRHFGFYASLRDNHENEILALPDYYTQEEGAVWKMSGKGGDYSEMRGGISFSWNWGSVALVKDHFEWGENYHGSNIFSGRAPSFPYIELRMRPVKWFGYTFLTGWMNSDVTDSSQGYNIPNSTRSVYFLKFLSAALFTFTPWRALDLSAGSSVISCSKSYDPAFLSPFLFFLNSDYGGDSLQQKYYGRNSQLFVSLSSRQLRHLHIYSTIFFDGNEYGKSLKNKAFDGISMKAGAKLTNFPLKNLSLAGEYTWSNQNVYLCSVATLTYASNEYGLGHYLKNNSRELFLEAIYKPLRGLHVTVDYILARHGDKQSGGKLVNISWKQDAVSVGVNYEFINNANVFIQYIYSDTEGNAAVTPDLFTGIKNTLAMGVNIGF